MLYPAVEAYKTQAEQLLASRVLPSFRIQSISIAMKRPDFIKNYKDLMDEDNAHYPGSDELLSIGAPVGRALGLKNIGIHIESLPPGRRTSWPHAEKEEEEFAYIIEGKPQAWIDGDVYDLSPGDFIAFPSGTGIAHTFINNTGENVLMLVGGEASKPENKIFYPLHPKRNEEMKDKDAFWENHPNRELGNHDGLPDSLRNKNG